ncbi:hypothetical protein ABZU76_03000 [Amycolatopsis sp. NPDC005232]|uniref:hypothetical protein n=1 Tax=Amycolatopsis sp. NPDC005232 TaxID=3157027 RepID=UPI0033B87CA8
MGFTAGQKVRASQLNALTARGGECWSTGTAGVGQTLNAAATKLQFPNIVVPFTGDITFNGTDTWTTGALGLVVDILCQLRNTGNVVGGVAIMSGTAYSDANALIAPFATAQSSGGWGDKGVSGSIYVPPNTTITAWFYNAGTSTTVAQSTRPAKFSIWGRALG